ncbi:MAG: HEAT repeat domain-containing protein, partial [Thermoanaerobaculia bacterium]
MRTILCLLLCAITTGSLAASEMNPKPDDPGLCTPSWLQPGKQDASANIDALIKQLESSPDKNARILAARSLGRAGDRRAEQPLIAALRSPDKNVRTEAAWALGHFTPASEPALAGALDDASSHVRMAASCSLGKVGTGASRPALQRLAAHDPDALVVAAAQWALHLSVGDKAPELKVLRWFKGKPRSLPLPGSVNVIEFWATWCGP